MPNEDLNIIAKIEEKRGIMSVRLKVRAAVVDNRGKLVPFQTIEASLGDDKKTIKIGAAGKAVVELEADLIGKFRRQVDLCLKDNPEVNTVTRIESKFKYFSIVSIQALAMIIAALAALVDEAHKKDSTDKS